MKEFEDLLKKVTEGNTEGLGNLGDLGKIFGGSSETNPLDILETLKNSGLGNIVEGSNPFGGIFEGVIGSILGDKECGEEGCCKEGNCESNPFFGDIFGEAEFDLNSFGAANIVENEKNYVVTVALPGISKTDIKVSAEEENLIVSVNVGEESEDENYILSEYKKESVERDFYLPRADFTKLKANFKNGELKVEVPKVEVETVFFDIK